MSPLFLLTAVAASCPAYPLSKDGALAAEQDWVKAIETRDVATLDCLLAPDFSDSNWRGAVVTRAQMLDGFAQRPHVTLVLDQLSVDLHGTIAIIHGRNQQTDASGEPTGAARFTDVFVWRDGRWRAVSAQETVIAS